MAASTHTRRDGLHRPAEQSHGAVAQPRSLLIASGGGHLAELVDLASRMPLLGEPLWVTFETPQATTLLGDADVEYVRTTGPRDLRNTLRNLPEARRILREHNVVEVISTGAAIAVSFLPLAAAHGIPAHYVESAARSHAPSLTGRMMRRAPRVTCYSQYRRWADGPWHYGGGVLDGFAPAAAHRTDRDLDHLRVFVTLGTQEYRFDRLVDAVQRIARPGWEITWQVGPNNYEGLQGHVEHLLDTPSFIAACASANVVIGQSGVGTALAAIEQGTVPIIVPREQRAHEHVDDHQRLIADELTDRGLALAVTPEDLTIDAVQRAIQLRVERRRDPVPFALMRQ